MVLAVALLSAVACCSPTRREIVWGANADTRLIMTKIDHTTMGRSLHGGAEHRLQLARRRLGLRVVIPADVPASHEDVGHRPLPSHLEERGLDRRPVLVLVERDGGDLLRTKLLEERLVRVRVRVRDRDRDRVRV